MTSTTFDRRPVTTGLIAMLEAVASATVVRTLAGHPPPGKIIGDARAPDPVPGETYCRLPYAVVYGLPGGQVGHTWVGDEMASLTYQVTCVGDQRDQAEGMADLIRAAILDVGAVGHAHAIATTGASKVIGRFLESPGGPTPEGTLWNVADIFRLEISIR